MLFLSLLMHINPIFTNALIFSNIVELDRTVVITSVGVENFVLCTRDTVNVIMFIHIISKLDSAIQIEFSLPKQTRESDSELSEGQGA